MHNVKTDFGPACAHGNGSTDDWAAIQGAIDAVAAAGGGILHFPPGNYRFTQPLTLRPFVTLVGEGQNTTTLLRDGPGDGLRAVYTDETRVSNIVVKALRVQATAQHQASVGINLAWTCLENTLFEDVEVLGFGWHGWLIDNVMAAQFSRCLAKSNQGNGFAILGNAPALFSTCRANGNHYDGFSLDGGADLNIYIGGVFHACSAVTNGRHGLRTGRRSGLVFSAGWIEDNAADAVRLSGASPAVVVRDTVIRGGANTLATSAGVRADNGTTGVVTGCSFFGFASKGGNAAMGVPGLSMYDNYEA